MNNLFNYNIVKNVLILILICGFFAVFLLKPKHSYNFLKSDNFQTRYLQHNEEVKFEEMKELSQLEKLEESGKFSKLENLRLRKKSAHDRHILLEVKNITQCFDRPRVRRMELRGNYWVLYNFVLPDTQYRCHESVTLTTHGDFTFLDNLVPLVERWRGPVSLTLYSPGEDFESTLKSIAYLRNCDETRLVRKYVTFHVFFDNTHLPDNKYFKVLKDTYIDWYNCSQTQTKPHHQQSAPYHVNHESIYKQRHNLTYPINVGRNVAREMALTHFIFPSDIELYPTRGFIMQFLTMIARNGEYEARVDPRVYVLPIFEVVQGAKVPGSKEDLRKMVRGKRAFTFHLHICRLCHEIPRFNKWMSSRETEKLEVFTTVKRLGDFRMWEAFFVGTHGDPIFDERLTWEGQSNKMTQGYALCLLNYDYMVLNNAFLIHKPGIKKAKVQLEKYNYLVAQTDYFLRHIAKVELDSIYGYRNGCRLYLGK